MWSTSEDVITRIVDYIFEHKEPFDLLINHAAGSGYEHFLDDLVEEEVSQSLAYLDAMRERGLACASPSHDDLHALVSAEYYASSKSFATTPRKRTPLRASNSSSTSSARLGEPLRR